MGVLITSSTPAASRTVRVTDAVDHAARPCLPDQRALAHPATGRLESDQPALARRDADGAAAVVGVRHRHHAGGHRGRRPARRATGRMSRDPTGCAPGGSCAARWSPWCRAPARWCGRAGRSRPPGTAPRDRTSPATAMSRSGPMPNAVGSPATVQPRSLNRIGTPRNGPSGRPPSASEPCRVEPGPDHSVQLRVDRLDPGDGRLCQLLGANLAAADKVGLCGGIQPRGLDHDSHATRVRRPSDRPGPQLRARRRPGP